MKQEIHRCALCGARRLPLAFTATKDARDYASYYCADCQLYQTQGDVAPVSPDYVDLAADDLDELAVFTQTAHKHAAFGQWAALMSAMTGRSFGGPGRETRSLLEIGCGIGGFLDFAAPLGLDCYGFDASRAQVAAAVVRHPHVSLATDVGAYVAGLATPPRFDFAVMWDVLEHIREPAALLAALQPLMAPGGLLFVSVPNARPVRAKLLAGRIAGRPVNDALLPWEHVFYHSPKSLRRLFAVTGWRVLAIGGVATYTRPPNLAEILRRLGHVLLRRTPAALQIHAIAMPDREPVGG